MVRSVAVCNIQLSMGNENIIGQFFQCATYLPGHFPTRYSTVCYACVTDSVPLYTDL